MLVTYRKVINSYYEDINNIADLIGKLVNSYRVLIGAADELNRIGLASRGDIKDALNRAKDLGDIIEELISTLDHVAYNYVEYAKIKSQAIKSITESQNIVNEINEQLKLKD